MCHHIYVIERLVFIFFSNPILMRPENADALFKTVMNFYFSHITILLFHFNHKSSFYTCDIRLYIFNSQKPLLLYIH